MRAPIEHRPFPAFLPLGLLALTACGRTPPASAETVSGESPRPPLALWEHAAERPQFIRVGRPFASEHFERIHTEILVNPKALAECRTHGPTHRFSVGTIALAELFPQSPGAHGSGPILAMQKQADGYFPEGGDFEYLKLTEGLRVTERGRLESCARCHHEAPSGFVFSCPFPRTEAEEKTLPPE